VSDKKYVWPSEEVLLHAIKMAERHGGVGEQYLACLDYCLGCVLDMKRRGVDIDSLPPDQQEGLDKFREHLEWLCEKLGIDWDEDDKDDWQ
jgi:hypothetical protein